MRIPPMITQLEITLQRQRELDEMRAGPHLDGDRIIVPSHQYNPAAAEFWKLHGFLWVPESETWERDTNLMYNQKNYRPECWLESTRREFYKFWPALAEREQTTPAAPTGSGIILDERHYQGNWR